MKITVCALSLLIFFCCNQKIEEPDFKGQYVSEIKNRIVYFHDSDNTLDLSKDDLVYYLVRHAEKDSLGETGNLPLSDRGEQRAEVLGEIFKGTKLDEIYSTLYIRTLMTAAPTATAKGMKILPYDAQNLRSFVDSLSQRDDLSAILIVGHSNTTPAVANALSGTEYFNQAIAEEDYENFYVLSRSRENLWRAFALKYKIPTNDNE